MVSLIIASTALFYIVWYIYPLIPALKILLLTPKITTINLGVLLKQRALQKINSGVNDIITHDLFKGIKKQILKAIAKRKLSVVIIFDEASSIDYVALDTIKLYLQHWGFEIDRDMSEMYINWEKVCLRKK